MQLQQQQQQRQPQPPLPPLLPGQFQLTHVRVTLNVQQNLVVVEDFKANRRLEYAFATWQAISAAFKKLMEHSELLKPAPQADDSVTGQTIYSEELIPPTAGASLRLVVNQYKQGYYYYVRRYAFLANLKGLAPTKQGFRLDPLDNLHRVTEQMVSLLQAAEVMYTCPPKLSLALNPAMIPPPQPPPPGVSTQPTVPSQPQQQPQQPPPPPPQQQQQHPGQQPGQHQPQPRQQPPPPPPNVATSGEVEVCV